MRWGVVAAGMLLALALCGDARADESGEEAEESIDLLEANRAWLSVDAAKGLVVMLDGERFGVTPLVDAPVMAGVHTIQLWHRTKLLHEHELHIEPGERVDWSAPVLDVADLREKRRQPPVEDAGSRARLKVRPRYRMPLRESGTWELEVVVLVDEKGRIVKRTDGDCPGATAAEEGERQHKRLCMAVSAGPALLQEEVFQGMKQARWWPMEEAGEPTKFFVRTTVRFAKP